MLHRINLVEHVASLSDHCGVLMEVSLPDIGNTNVKKIFNETYWKLNASILKDDDFHHNFTDVWSQLQTKKVLYNDIADWWDMEAKPNIRELCIQFSKQRKLRRSDS